MELFMDILLMLGGVAVFMYGMKQMSQGLEQGVGSGVRRLFKKINKNRVIDYGLGITATAVVQSSSATSIMTVGLANAGIVTVKQGSGIVLGAKVGTTLTAFIFAIGLVSKGGFSISMLFASFAFIGVVIIFTTDKPGMKKIALMLVGFGMLFVGLEVMESAIGGTDSILKNELEKLFAYEVMLNPILLLILGIVFTCIIQSSSAATVIFIAFLSTGVIKSIDQSFFLIMGANIGTCSDGLMASLGTNENGKRIALFHLLSSTIGALFFTVVLIVFKKPIIDLFSLFSKPEWALAVYNLSYNVIYTLVLLAFLDPLVALVTRVVKKKERGGAKAYALDERLLATPMIAVEQSVKEVYSMAQIANSNIDRAFYGLISGSTAESDLIAEDEYKIDDMTRALASYFIKISSIPSVSAKDDKLIGGLHHVINDIERISDYAVMLAKETSYMVQLETAFMDETKTELTEIYAKIDRLFVMALKTFQSRDTKELKAIATLHAQIEEQIISIKDIHIKRLSSGVYPVEVSKSLYTALISLQRVSDHIVNIAFSIRSDTGSKTETFALLEKDKKRIN